MGMNALTNQFIPDFAGAYGQGQDIFQRRQESQNQNALRQALQQYGPAAMQGDPNALRALAQHDPNLAMGLMGDQQAMDLQRQQNERQATESAHGIKMDEEQLALARRKAAEQTAEHAATMSAIEREQSVAELDRALAGATQAKTPEEWDALMGQNPNTKDLVGQFEQRDILVASALGVKDALSMKEPPKPMSPAGKLQADLDSGRISQDMFNAEVQNRAPQGMTVEATPEGGSRIVMGPAGKGKPLTEAQSKDNFYLTATKHARDLDEYEKSLSGISGAANKVAGSVPVVGKFAQSEAYQVGQVAASEWGAAILRKESGAALTDADHQWLENRFIPVPGDKPKAIARKRAARRAAEAGLQSGMSQAQIEAVVDSLEEVEDAPAGSGNTSSGVQWRLLD